LGLLFTLLLELKYLIKFILPISTIVIILLVSGFQYDKYINDETSVTLSRLNSNKKDNSIDGRLSLWEIDFQNYDHNGISMPFIGGGFYVSAINGHHRIGYGKHNNYLFVFEQGGIIALILFLVFWTQTLLYLRRMWKKSSNRPDRGFAFAALIYFICLTFLNVVGQIFVRGFNNNNMNAYIIVILALALLPSTPVGKKKVHG